MFLDGPPLPLARPAQNHLAFEASIEDPTRNFTGSAADFGAAHPSPCHLLPQKDRVFQDLSVFSGNPNAQPRKQASCFGHSHSVSAYRNAQADCAGLSCPVALSNGAQVHSMPGNEGGMNLQRFPPKYTTTAFMPLREEAVHSLHKGQGDNTERHGHEEDGTSTCVEVDDLHAPPRLICAGSAHVVTKPHDPSLLSSMATMNSCEESTGLHEECGDSTVPQESYKDLNSLHAGCDDTEDLAHVRTVRGGSAIGYDGVQDPLEEVLDPYLQQADADATSSLQPYSSECSSAISTVSDAMPEITSRLDSSYNGDAGESNWTDAKHGSYLDYMETSFVKHLYGREYCALDVCGQQPFHQASQNSSPWRSALFEFKCWQSGDWRRRSMLKPPLLTCIPLTLRPSPWVNHFWHRKVPYARQTKVEDASTFCGVDGEEEVNSPAIELCREAPGHDYTSRSNFGHDERLPCKIGSRGSEAVGVSKHDGLQEFPPDSDVSCRRNMKKRRLDSNSEQDQARQACEKYMRR